MKKILLLLLLSLGLIGSTQASDKLEMLRLGDSFIECYGSIYLLAENESNFENKNMLIDTFSNYSQALRSAYYVAGLNEDERNYRVGAQIENWFKKYQMLKKDDPHVLLRTARNCGERDGDIQVLIDMLESANFGF
jgi:hypothetical protein